MLSNKFMLDAWGFLCSDSSPAEAHWPEPPLQTKAVIWMHFQVQNKHLRTVSSFTWKHLLLLCLKVVLHYFHLSLGYTKQAVHKAQHLCGISSFLHQRFWFLFRFKAQQMFQEKTDFLLLHSHFPTITWNTASSSFPSWGTPVTEDDCCSAVFHLRALIPTQKSSQRKTSQSSCVPTEIPVSKHAPSL